MNKSLKICESHIKKCEHLIKTYKRKIKDDPEHKDLYEYFIDLNQLELLEFSVIYKELKKHIKERSKKK